MTAEGFLLAQKQGIFIRQTYLMFGMNGLCFLLAFYYFASVPSRHKPRRGGISHVKMGIMYGFMIIINLIWMVLSYGGSFDFLLTEGEICHCPEAVDCAFLYYAIVIVNLVLPFAISSIIIGIFEIYYEDFPTLLIRLNELKTIIRYSIILSIGAILFLIIAAPPFGLWLFSGPILFSLGSAYLIRGIINCPFD